MQGPSNAAVKAPAAMMALPLAVEGEGRHCDGGMRAIGCVGLHVLLACNLGHGLICVGVCFVSVEVQPRAQLCTFLRSHAQGRLSEAARRMSNDGHAPSCKSNEHRHLLPLLHACLLGFLLQYPAQQAD